MRRFMYGRYGIDQLNVFLIAAAVVLNLISLLLSRLGAVCAILGMVVNLLSYGLLVWCMYRALSRNLEKRFLENRICMTKSEKMRNLT